MKWIRHLSAVVAIASLSATANVSTAGLLDSGCGAAKSCGCAPTCQPRCCKPTITRPCDVSVHTYQRKCSDIKPPCCNTCCAPKTCCKPAPVCCKPAPVKCCKPAPVKCCKPAPTCCAPKTCYAPKNCCCETKCCDADPCEIAELIYKSQTACYARDRRSAIHKLGDKFDCQCNPEIMVAMVYALNDADERVRAKAADEIGDQLRMNPCCCTKEVTAALTCALGDCDRAVRRQATEGLEACGYEVVDGCCCKTCCNSCNSCGGSAAPAPAGDGEVAPAPPAGDPKAYFPSRLQPQHTTKAPVRRSRLSNIFGFLD